MDKFIYLLGFPLFVAFVGGLLRTVILLFIVLPISHFFFKDKKAVDGIFELFTKAFRPPKIYWMLLFVSFSVPYLACFWGGSLYVLVPLTFLSGVTVVDTQWIRLMKKRRKK